MEMPAGLKNEIERRAAQVGVKALSAAAEAMSQAYRAEHGTGKRLVQGETAVLAYGAVRMPATYGAVYKALRLSMACYNGEVRSVLDVGAGTGAACWAAQALLPTYAAYTCIEREPAMLALGKGLMAEQEELCDAEWILADMTAGLGGQKADLVMASYTLNELTEQARTDMVSKLWEGTEGMLLIIEPGTPEGSRQLRAAREQLIAAGAQIAAPCPHTDKCPMTGEDWCHFTARIARSRLHKQLKGGDVPYEDEKFCFLAAVRGEAAPAQARILRHPNVQAGRVELTLCTAEGKRERRTVTKADKENFKRARKSEQGEAF